MTVFERSTGISQHGDSVILGSNATILLHRWGCGEELWLKSSRGKYMVFMESQGKILYKEDLEELYALSSQAKPSHVSDLLTTCLRKPFALWCSATSRQEIAVPGNVRSSSSITRCSIRIQSRSSRVRRLERSTWSYTRESRATTSRCDRGLRRDQLDFSIGTPFFG